MGMISDDTIPLVEDLSPAFRAFGHPHRLNIIRMLMERDLACCTSQR